MSTLRPLGALLLALSLSACGGSPAVPSDARPVGSPSLESVSDWALHEGEAYDEYVQVRWSRLGGKDCLEVASHLHAGYVSTSFTCDVNPSDAVLADVPSIEPTSAWFHFSEDSDARSVRVAGRDCTEVRSLTHAGYHAVSFTCGTSGGPA